MTRVLARASSATARASQSAPTPKIVDAVYRKGVVVDASLELGHDDAMKTARELASTAMVAKLERAAVKALRESIDNVAVGAWSGAGSVKSTHHPIVDYPAFLVSVNGQDALVRVSLTVCRNQSKSKLWTRVSPLQRSGNLSGFDNGVMDLAYFDLARAISAAIEPAAVDFYQSHLAKIAPKAVSLVSLHSIQVAAIDCEDGEAWRLLDAIREAERRGLPIKGLTEENRFRHLWSALEGLFTHLTGTSVDQLDYPSRMEPMRVEVDEDRKGFFFWKKGPGKSSSLVGLCPTDRDYSRPNAKGHHTGRSVTALLINRLASTL